MNTLPPAPYEATLHNRALGLLKSQFHWLVDQVETQVQEIAVGRMVDRCLKNEVEYEVNRIVDAWWQDIVDAWWQDNVGWCRWDGRIVGLDLRKSDIWFAGVFDEVSGQLNIKPSPSIIRVIEMEYE